MPEKQDLLHGVLVTLVERARSLLHEGKYAEVQETLETAERRAAQAQGHVLAIEVSALRADACLGLGDVRTAEHYFLRTLAECYDAPALHEEVRRSLRAGYRARPHLVHGILGRAHAPTGGQSKSFSKLLTRPRSGSGSGSSRRLSWTPSMSPKSRVLTLPPLARPNDENERKKQKLAVAALGSLGYCAYDEGMRHGIVTTARYKKLRDAAWWYELAVIEAAGMRERVYYLRELGQVEMNRTLWHKAEIALRHAVTLLGEIERGAESVEDEAFTFELPSADGLRRNLQTAVEKKEARERAAAARAIQALVWRRWMRQQREHEDEEEGDDDSLGSQRRLEEVESLDEESPTAELQVAEAVARAEHVEDETTRWWNIVTACREGLGHLPGGRVQRVSTTGAAGIQRMRVQAGFTSSEEEARTGIERREDIQRSAAAAKELEERAAAVEAAAARVEYLRSCIEPFTAEEAAARGGTEAAEAQGRTAHAEDEAVGRKVAAEAEAARLAQAARAELVGAEGEARKEVEQTEASIRAAAAGRLADAVRKADDANARAATEAEETTARTVIVEEEDGERTDAAAGERGGRHAADLRAAEGGEAVARREVHAAEDHERNAAAEAEDSGRTAIADVKAAHRAAQQAEEAEKAKLVQAVGQLEADEGSARGDVEIAEAEGRGTIEGAEAQAAADAAAHQAAREARDEHAKQALGELEANEGSARGDLEELEAAEREAVITREAGGRVAVAAVASAAAEAAAATAAQEAEANKQMPTGGAPTDVEGDLSKDAVEDAAPAAQPSEGEPKASEAAPSPEPSGGDAAEAAEDPEPAMDAAATGRLADDECAGRNYVEAAEAAKWRDLGVREGLAAARARAISKLAAEETSGRGEVEAAERAARGALASEAADSVDAVRRFSAAAKAADRERELLWAEEQSARADVAEGETLAWAELASDARGRRAAVDAAAAIRTAIGDVVAAEELRRRQEVSAEDAQWTMLCEAARGDRPKAPVAPAEPAQQNAAAERQTAGGGGAGAAPPPPQDGQGVQGEPAPEPAAAANGARECDAAAPAAVGAEDAPPNPRVDAARAIAKELDHAMRGLGTDEETVVAQMGRVKTQAIWTRVQTLHEDMFAQPLLSRLRTELSDADIDRCRARMAVNGVLFDHNDRATAESIARQLNQATDGWGTDEDVVFTQMHLVSSQRLWMDVQGAFAESYGVKLRARLQADLTEDELVKCIAILRDQGVVYNEDGCPDYAKLLDAVQADEAQARGLIASEGITDAAALVGEGQAGATKLFDAADRMDVVLDELEERAVIRDEEKEVWRDLHDDMRDSHQVYTKLARANKREALRQRVRDGESAARDDMAGDEATQRYAMHDDLTQGVLAIEHAAQIRGMHADEYEGRQGVEYGESVERGEMERRNGSDMLATKHSMERAAMLAGEADARAVLAGSEPPQRAALEAGCAASALSAQHTQQRRELVGDEARARAAIPPTEPPVWAEMLAAFHREAKRISAAGAIQRAYRGHMGRRRAAAHRWQAMAPLAQRQWYFDEADVFAGCVADEEAAGRAAMARALHQRRPSTLAVGLHRAERQALEGSEGIVRSSLEDEEDTRRAKLHVAFDGSLEEVTGYSPRSAIAAMKRLDAQRRNSADLHRSHEAAFSASLELSFEHILAALEGEQERGWVGLFGAFQHGRVRILRQADSDIDSAATKIQSVFRGHCDRRKAGALRAGFEDKILAEDEAEVQAEKEALNREFEAKTRKEQDEEAARVERLRDVRRSVKVGGADIGRSEAHARRGIVDEEGRGRVELDLTLQCMKEAEEVRMLFAEEQNAAKTIQRALRGFNGRVMTHNLRSLRVLGAKQRRADKVGMGRRLQGRELAVKHTQAAWLERDSQRAVKVSKLKKKLYENVSTPGSCVSAHSSLLTPGSNYALGPAAASPGMGMVGVDGGALSPIGVEDLPLPDVHASEVEEQRGRKIDAFVSKAKDEEWDRHTRTDHSRRAKEGLTGHLPARRRLLPRKYCEPLGKHERATRDLIEADERFQRKHVLGAYHDILPTKADLVAEARAQELILNPPPPPSFPGEEVPQPPPQRRKLLPEEQARLDAYNTRVRHERNDFVDTENLHRRCIAEAEEQLWETIEHEDLAGRVDVFESTELRERKERLRQWVQDGYDYELLLVVKKEAREREELYDAVGADVVRITEDILRDGLRVNEAGERMDRSDVEETWRDVLALIKVRERVAWFDVLLRKCAVDEACEREVVRHRIKRAQGEMIKDMRVDERIAREVIEDRVRDEVLERRRLREVRRLERAAQARGFVEVAVERNNAVVAGSRPSTAGAAMALPLQSQSLEPAQRAKLNEIRTQSRTQQLGAKPHFKALAYETHVYSDTVLAQRQASPPKREPVMDKTLYNPYHSHMDDLPPPPRVNKAYQFTDNVHTMAVDAQAFLQRRGNPGAVASMASGFNATFPSANGEKTRKSGMLPAL